MVRLLLLLLPLTGRKERSHRAALSRGAAEGQLPRNASGMHGSRGHTSVSVTLRDTQKKHTQDGEDKGEVDVRSRLAGELWRRLSRGGVGALKSYSRGLRNGGHVHVVFLDEL